LRHPAQPGTLCRLRRSQMGSDTSAVVPAEVTAIPLSTWWESRGIARATAFRLVKMAGIKPEPLKVPTSRAPVSGITSEQVAILDQLAQRLQDGATLSRLEAELSTAIVAASSPAETVSDDPGPVAAAMDAGPLLARLEAGERAIRTGLPLSTPEVTWILGARPGGDRVTRAGVEAIRHGRNCWQLRRSEPI